MKQMKIGQLMTLFLNVSEHLTLLLAWTQTSDAFVLISICYLISDISRAAEMLSSHSYS